MEFVRSRRLVLRPGVGEEEVHEFAADLQYPTQSDTPADDDRMEPRQIIWHADNGAVIAYREDIYSGLPCVIIMAESPEDLLRYVDLFESRVDVWTIPELLHEVDVSEDPYDLSEAVLRMGLGAPVEYQEEFFSRIHDGLRDEHEGVVRAALLAVTYEPWEQYLPIVRELLDHDVDDDVKHVARQIIGKFAAGEAGEG